jgi:cobalamin synthase
VLQYPQGVEVAVRRCMRSVPFIGLIVALIVLIILLKVDELW